MLWGGGAVKKWPKGQEPGRRVGYDRKNPNTPVAATGAASHPNRGPEALPVLSPGAPVSVWVTVTFGASTEL